MKLKKAVKTGLAQNEGTQELLAIHLGKSTATVSKYMNGHIDPPFSVILTMCEYFKVSASDFCKWGE